MNAKLFFRRAEKMYRELLVVTENIEASSQADVLKKYERILMETDQSIRSLKGLLSGVNFTSLAEELYFFKELKPLFVSQFIYFSRLLALEAAKPNAGPQILKEYYEYELQHLQLFLEEYREFYEYYRRKATYLDQKYFVRKQFDFTMGVDPNMYHFDEQFTTSHDHLVARILANDRLEKYLLQSIYHIEGYFYEKFSDRSPLTWTGPKSGLIELLHGLHVMRCFNGGNVDFSETVRLVEKAFNVPLGNFYKTLHDIKNRKTGRTKFLQALAESLEQHFESMMD